MKLFDSEYKIMEILWEHGDLPAAEIAKIVIKDTGWSLYTAYSVIRKSVNKGIIERYGDNYMCKPLISREESQHHDAKEMVNKRFGGSIMDFFMSFVGSAEQLEPEEVEKLKKIIEDNREDKGK